MLFLVLDFVSHAVKLMGQKDLSEEKDQRDFPKIFLLFGYHKGYMNTIREVFNVRLRCWV